jgi:hypothetical protein
MPPRVTVGLMQFSGPMMVGSAQFETAQRAIFAIDRGDTLQGLIALECSPQLRTMPAVESYLGYCIAKERGEFREGVRLCQAALTAEPDNPAHYLNLGRVLLMTQDKAKAIATFWKGISKAPGGEMGVLVSRSQPGRSREHNLILDELRRLGIRKKSPFASLHRTHPLNRMAGKVLATLGLR